MIRMIKKLLGKEKSHEQWLEENPSKHTTTTGAPALVTPEEEARVREKMEGELTDQRTKRDDA